MDRFYELTCPIPHNTPIAAPVSFSWPLEDATLRNIAITIPDGHNGLTGIRVIWSNQQIIPWGNLSWITANNRTIPIAFNDYITLSGLVVQAYNTDVFDHSFYLESIVSDLPSPIQLAQAASPVTAVLPPAPAVTPDPLSPQSLLDSLPAEVRAEILAGTVT